MKTFKFIHSVILIGILCFSACKDDKVDAPQELYPDLISLPDLRNLYTGSTDYIFDIPKRITGVVISNTVDKNNDAGDLVLQNVNTGITISFSSGPATYTYVTGDSIAVVIKKGAKLSRSTGTLKLTGIDALKETYIIAGKKVKKPKVVSLTELSANFSSYESTLVTVTGDITPLPAVSDVLSGSKRLDDITTSDDIYINTLATATFSGTAAPRVKAIYTGIAFTGLTTPVKQVRIQKVADMVLNPLVAYPNFPEGAEANPVIEKTAYESPAFPNNKIAFGSGVWILEGVGLRPKELVNNVPGTTYDTRNGANAFRFPNNNTIPRYLQMDFDVPNGAQRVTFEYAHWNNGADTFGGTLQLEYSTNQGATWTKTGSDILVRNANSFLKATFDMNITVPVRFRIVKSSVGTSSAGNPNGRINIDDITIFK